MLGDLHRDVPELLGWYLTYQPTWINRTVDQARFPRPDTLERRISVDFSWHPEQVASQLDLPARAGRGVPVPLGLLRKEVLSGFNLEDEHGTTLPILTTEQNQQLTVAVVAYAVVERALGLPRKVATAKATRRLLQLLVGPVSPEQRKQQEEFLDRQVGLSEKQGATDPQQLVDELRPLLARDGNYETGREDTQYLDSSSQQALHQLAHAVVSLRRQSIAAQNSDIWLAEAEGRTEADRRLIFAHWWLSRVNNAYVLYVDLNARSQKPRLCYGRRIIKLRYEAESQRRPWRTARRRPNYLPGFRTTFEITGTRGIESQSSHTELIPPDEVAVDHQRTQTVPLGGEEKPVPPFARGGHAGRAHAHVGDERGRAQLYHLYPVLERGTTRLASRSAWGTAALLVALTFLSAKFGWAELETQDPQIAAVSIFLLVPSLLAGYAATRADEHYVNSTLIRLPRRVLGMLAFVWATSAAPIAFGSHLPIPSVGNEPVTWEWWAITSAVAVLLGTHLQLRIALVRWWGGPDVAQVSRMARVQCRVVQVLDSIRSLVNRRFTDEPVKRPSGPLKLRHTTTGTAVIAGFIAWVGLRWVGSLISGL